MLKKLGALTLAAAMFVSSTAFAATNANQGALSQGIPATVKQAQSRICPVPLLWILGGGVVIGGVVLIASGNGHSHESNTTTCSLGGCPTTTTSTTTSH
jgi:hypothetical protein